MIVQAPDNKTIDFGDMPPEQITAAMQKLYPPAPSVSDYATDIGKSAATGLGQGAIGLVTGPVDLGAMGGSYLAKKAIGDNTFGIQEGGPVDKTLNYIFGNSGLGLPQAPPSLTGMALNATGLDYQPKTLPGKYANTMASFAPALAAGNIGNGASLLSNAGNVVKNSVLAGGASEGAGQVAAGSQYEPAARIAGAMAPSLIGKGFSPTITDETKAPAMQTAEDFNIPVYRNQVSDNGLTKAAASLEKEIPLTGAASKVNAQTNAFNDAVAGTIGEKGAVTPEKLNSAYDRISGVYDQVLGNNDMPVTPKFQQDYLNLISKGTSIGDSAKEHAFTTMAQNVADKIQNGILPGETYQGIRSQIGRLMRNPNSSSPELGALQNLIDEQFSNSMPMNDATAFNQARTQYRNLLALEGPVGRNPNAPISPASLQGAVRTKFGDYAYGGQSDLERLARLGNLLKDNYPNSGTAQRGALLGAAKTLGKGALGLGLGYEAAKNPEETFGGTAAALLMSRFGLTPYLYQQMTTNPQAFQSMVPAMLGSANKEARQ